MLRGVRRAFPGTTYAQAVCQLVRDRAVGPKLDRGSPLAAPCVDNADPHRVRPRRRGRPLRLRRGRARGPR
eukprot:8689308-Lingulodinium_polyedra.AAC.1